MEEIIQEQSPYISSFATKEDVIQEFRAPADALDDATVLLAWYGSGDYEGDALVVFVKGGVLYEVRGSHCSCYGLEDQWEPEETTWTALSMRDFSQYYEGSQAANDLLKKLVCEHLGGDA